MLLLALVVSYPLPALASWVQGRPLQWLTAMKEPGPAVDHLSRPGVSVTYADSAIWTIQSSGAAQWAAALVPGLLTWVFLLVGGGLAWRLVRTTLGGEPFTVAGARWLRALLVIGYGVVVPFARLFVDLVVMWSVDETDALVSIIDPSAFALPRVIGFLVLVLAECFSIGRRLADDAVGLV